MEKHNLLLRGVSKARRFVVILGCFIFLCVLLVVTGTFSSDRSTLQEQENPTIETTSVPSTATEPAPETEPTAPETEPTSAETEPTVPERPMPIKVALTGNGPQEILELMEVENLVYVNARASTYYEELMALIEAQPDCYVDYCVDLGGVQVSRKSESADIQGREISSEELGRRLQYLPNLRELNICDLGYTNEESLALIEAYPEIDFIWTVNFAKWAVRSDIQCFSSLQWADSYPRYTSDDFAPLFTYCTDLVALDLGHNNLTDLSALGNLKNLQVLILADNPTITDITPLGELTELRYLEIFMGWNIRDLSPLENLTKMVDLNLSYVYHLGNADFLDYMPDLRMGWFIRANIPYARRVEIRETHPDARFLYYDGDEISSTLGGWRATERNIAIRTAFTYWRYVVSFKSWDEVEYKKGARIYRVLASYE